MVPFERLGTASYSHSIPIAPILYHFRDKARYWSKIAIFIPSCIRRPGQRVTVGILRAVLYGKKTRMVWLREGEKSSIICLAVPSILLTQYRRVTDRLKDRQTDVLRQNSQRYAYSTVR